MSNTTCILSCHDKSTRLLGKSSIGSYQLRAPRSKVDIRASAAVAPGVLSAHPDAVARRQQAEERQRARADLSKSKTKNGDKWWDVPASSNVLSASSVPELQHVMEIAKAQGALVVVKFFAPHCAACKTMYPKVRQIADKNPEVMFLKVNAADNELQQYCHSIGISKIPFFHLYKAGALVAQFSANLTTINRLRGEITAYKA